MTTNSQKEMNHLYKYINHFFSTLEGGNGRYAIRQGRVYHGCFGDRSNSEANVEIIFIDRYTNYEEIHLHTNYTWSMNEAKVLRDELDDFVSRRYWIYY